jgi:hypothetical protein
MNAANPRAYAAKSPVAERLSRRGRPWPGSAATVAWARSIACASSIQPWKGRPFGELRAPGWLTDHDLGEALVAADRLDDRRRRLRVADQTKDGCRVVVDELVAHGRGVEHAHVEFDDGAAVWREVVLNDAGT